MLHEGMQNIKSELFLVFHTKFQRLYSIQVFTHNPILHTFYLDKTFHTLKYIVLFAYLLLTTFSVSTKNYPRINLDVLYNTELQGL